MVLLKLQVMCQRQVHLDEMSHHESLGYGILGHAKLLAARQRNPVNFVIHNLPVIHKMQNIAKACGNTFGLMQGVAPEISGGLLIALPREQVNSRPFQYSFYLVYSRLVGG